jgi:hypothetical protein
MLVGLGSLIGNGDLGSFHAIREKPVFWYYENGRAGAGFVASSEVQQPLILAKAPWVAVLMDGSTASAAEADVISFIGRPKTKSFGQALRLPFSISKLPLQLLDVALDLKTLVSCKLTLLMVQNLDRYSSAIGPSVQVRARSHLYADFRVTATQDGCWPPWSQLIK